RQRARLTGTPAAASTFARLPVRGGLSGEFHLGGLSTRPLRKPDVHQPPPLLLQPPDLWILLRPARPAIIYGYIDFHIQISPCRTSFLPKNTPVKAPRIPGATRRTFNEAVPGRRSSFGRNGPECG